MSGKRPYATWLVFTLGVGGSLVWGALTRPTPEGSSPAVADEAATTPLPPPIHEGGLIRRDLSALGVPFSMYAPSEAASAAAYRRLEQLDRALSPWRPGSELARLVPGGRPVALGADARALIARARKLARSSQGRYQPGAVELDGTSGRLISKTPFAPGPLLQGYAAQAALDAMSRIGAQHGAVRVGADRYLLGQADEAPWAVRLSNPLWPDRPVASWRAGPGAIAHAEGEPGSGCRLAVVITARRIRAATFAQVICRLGAEAGLRWAARRVGVEALVISADGGQRTSAGWQEATATTVEAPPVVRRAARHPGPESSEITRPPAPVNGPHGALDTTRSGATVSVAGRLHIDRTEVSNAAYARFLEAEAPRPHRFCHPEEPEAKDHRPRYWREYRGALFRARPAAKLAPFDADTFRDPQRPVVGVDWWDAYAFANWAGKRLPTQAEWRQAAGAGVWPWGDRWQYARANTGGEKWGERDGHIYAAPVDAFPAGAAPCGALNLAGNVAEWTLDGGVVGGSSRSTPSGVRTTASAPRRPGYRSFDLGLRCVVDVAPADPKVAPKTAPELTEEADG